MRRFFTDRIAPDGLAELTGGDVNHIRDVLRMQPGDAVMLAADGQDYAAEIVRIERAAVICRAFRPVENLAEPRVEITLYQGLPKGDKMELIIQKCVELGISAIVPVQCERSVARLTAENTDKKLTRWQRMAEEAAKQCGRGRVPVIGRPLTVPQVQAAGVGLFFWENESVRRLKAALPPDANRISIFVGPEGGVSADEAALLTAHGFLSVTLGARILRTETAGLAAVSAIMYHYDELG